MYAVPIWGSPVGLGAIRTRVSLVLLDEVIEKCSLSDCGIVIPQSMALPHIVFVWQSELLLSKLQKAM